MPDDLDDCLGLVSDRQRRRIIHRLRDAPDGETTVDVLAEHLCRGPSASVTGRAPDRDELVLQLAHTHLPKLAEHGVVEYDRDRGTVRYRPDEQVEQVLDSLPRSAVPVDR